MNTTVSILAIAVSINSVGIALYINIYHAFLEDKSFLPRGSLQDCIYP